jgi:MFS family permease
MQVRSRFDFLGLRENTLVVSVTEFIHDSGLHWVNPFFSLYVLALGGELADLALLSLIQGLISLISHPLLGSLSDRIGRKKPIVIGGFIVALGPFLNAFAGNWIGLIPGQMLATADGGLWNVRQALFADSSKKESRGVGFASFFTIMQLGSIFMPTIGGVILDLEGIIIGMRIGYIYSGLAKLFQTLINAKYLKEKKDTKSFSHVKSIKEKEVSKKNPIKVFFQPIIANKMLQVMVIGSTALFFCWGLFMRYMVVYATDIIGISNTEWGIIQSAMGWVNFTRIPFGKLADRYGRRKFILLSYFTRPIFHTFFVLSGNFSQVFISRILSTLSMNLNGPAWQALIADITPATERGRFYASTGMIGTILSNTSPMIGAFLWNNYGPAWPFYASILLFLLTAIFLLIFLKEPKK